MIETIWTLVCFVRICVCYGSEHYGLERSLFCSSSEDARTDWHGESSRETNSARVQSTASSKRLLFLQAALGSSQTDLLQFVKAIHRIFIVSVLSFQVHDV